MCLFCKLTHYLTTFSGMLEEEFLRLENKASWLLTAAAVDRVTLFFELLPWVPTLYSMTQRGLDDICTQSVVRQSRGRQSQRRRIFYNRLLFAPKRDSNFNILKQKQTCPLENIISVFYNWKQTCHLGDTLYSNGFAIQIFLRRQFRTKEQSVISKICRHVRKTNGELSTNRH